MPRCTSNTNFPYNMWYFWVFCISRCKQIHIGPLTVVVMIVT